VLRADRNKFNILPQPLSLCHSLNEMSFSDNTISTVPQLFNKMKGLRKLFLERNKFESIPQVPLSVKLCADAIDSRNGVVGMFWGLFSIDTQ
jgi:Leucine-rich repeat (LRR) protein